MKRLILLLSSVLMFGISEANALVITPVGAPEASCAITRNATFYGLDNYQLWDELSTSKPSLVSGNSEVQVYVRGGNKMSIGNGWTQATNYTPAAGTYLAVWNNSGSSLNLPNLVPSDRNGTPIGQIVYHIRRAPERASGSAMNAAWGSRTLVSGFPSASTSYGSATRYINPSEVMVENECYNIFPAWCGDGVVDAANGETCDQGAQNGQPGSSCSATCGATPFDLSILKLVNGQNANVPAAAVAVGTGTNYTYTVRVTNNGPGTVVGVTNVNDTNFPPEVQLVGIPSGNGWNCSLMPGGFTCARNDVLASGQSFPDITINAIIPAAAQWSLLQNTATVVNPNENPANNFGNNNSYTSFVVVGGFVVPPPPGGGGGQGSCNNLAGVIISNVGGILTETYTCEANPNLIGSNINYTLNCGNGGQVINGSNTTGTFTGTCNYNVGSINSTTIATCSVNNQAPGVCQLNPLNGTPGGGGGGGGGFNPFCGNGIIDVAFGETCDAGSFNGRPISNGVCNSSCRIGSTNPGGCTPGVPSPGCPIGFTNPGAYGINILLNGQPVSKYRAIVGNGVNVFDNDTFTLSTTFPVLVEGLTSAIVNNAWSHIAGSSVYGTLHGCVGPGSMSWTTGTQACSPSMQLFQTNAGIVQGQNFQGDTSGVATSADANPPTSPGSALLQNNFFVGVNYFTEPIPVRVSASIISSTAGGNASVGGSTLGVTVNSVTESFIDQLRKGNFTLAASRAEYSESSATGSSAANGSQIGSIGKFATSVATAPITNVNVTSVSDLNGNPNFTYGSNGSVVMLANGNLTVSSTLSLAWVKTIVVENGDLVITKDIVYADANSSYAFVVKKGNIIVDTSVSKLSGVYLVLNGEIRGNGSTSNQLVIDGNLYGKLSSLVNDRTYVRGINTSSALTTGVTVNYSTRAIKNPPPLLTQFLDQYELSRIAQ